MAVIVDGVRVVERPHLVVVVPVGGIGVGMHEFGDRLPVEQRVDAPFALVVGHGDGLPGVPACHASASRRGHTPPFG